MFRFLDQLIYALFAPLLLEKATPLTSLLYTPFEYREALYAIVECQVAIHPFLVPRSYLRQRSTEELYTPEKYQSGLALCGCLWREFFCKTGRQQQQQKQVLQGQLILLSYTICKCQESPKILEVWGATFDCNIPADRVGWIYWNLTYSFLPFKNILHPKFLKRPIEGTHIKNCWNRHCPNGSHKSLYMRVSELHWKSNLWLQILKHALARPTTQKS